MIRILAYSFLCAFLLAGSASAEHTPEHTYANNQAAEAPMTLDECASMWKKFMTTITTEDARIVCQCIEDEKKAHPVDANKGATIDGLGGMDNAGPWPNIFNKCLIQGVPTLKKSGDKNG